MSSPFVLPLAVFYSLFISAGDLWLLLLLVVVVVVLLSLFGGSVCPVL